MADPSSGLRSTRHRMTPVELQRVHLIEVFGLSYQEAGAVLERPAGHA